MIGMRLQSGVNQAPNNNKVREAKSQTVDPGWTEKTDEVGKKYKLVKKERNASYQLGKASGKYESPEFEILKTRT